MNMSNDIRKFWNEELDSGDEFTAGDLAEAIVNRIQEGEKAIAVLKRILAAHEVSSVDWDAMREAEKIILSFKEK
jgi:hypothetical protein